MDPVVEVSPFGTFLFALASACCRGFCKVCVCIRSMISSTHVTMLVKLKATRDNLTQPPDQILAARKQVALHNIAATACTLAAKRIAGQHTNHHPTFYVQCIESSCASQEAVMLQA